VIGALLALALLGGTPAADNAEVICRFTDDRLVEISGMALSQQHPDVLWLHNDSSGGPYLYAVSATTCETLARIEVQGIEARDLEGIALGVDRQGRPVMWLGDIGDNRDTWPYVWIHRIREPSVIEDQVVRARQYRITYPGGPLNAETVLADPQSQQLWVVTKQLARGGLYALPDPLRPRAVNTAERLQEEGPLVTDGAIAPSGQQYVLRDYVNARIYRGLPPGEFVQSIELPLQVQGEAITWSADERALLVTSERDDRLMRVPIPDAFEPTTIEPSPEQPEELEQPATSDESPAWWLLIPTGIVLAGVIAGVEVMRRRSAA
jgi:hypothetical protein